ncbi:MAG: hypothetical protein Q9222_001665 [Ikaeria aurantiellina]
MNQIVNVVLETSRLLADKSDEEALRMWKIWMDLLPAGVTTTVKPPYVGASSLERRQAVVWLGQEVYIALVDRAEDEFKDYLRIVTLWRDLTRDLGNEDGVNKIHTFLMDELGEVGPSLLD